MSWGAGGGQRRSPLVVPAPLALRDWVGEAGFGHGVPTTGDVRALGWGWELYAPERSQCSGIFNVQQFRHANKWFARCAPCAIQGKAAVGTSRTSSSQLGARGRQDKQASRCGITYCSVPRR